MTSSQPSPAHCTAAPTSRLDEIVDRLEGFLAQDPDLSFQAAAFHDGTPVLDVWGGPHLDEDSVTVPFSVTKNTIGLSIGLLVERGELDLDALVAEYWPEFAQKGKAHVTVRQLLSHQAGLPQATPALTAAELLDHHRRRGAPRRLDARSGTRARAFGYHGLTIGNLASELVFRVTGRTLHEFYEQEIRAPHGIDFYLGLPAEHDVAKGADAADDPAGRRHVDRLRLAARSARLRVARSTRRSRERRGQLAVRPPGSLGHRHGSRPRAPVRRGGHRRRRRAAVPLGRHRAHHRPAAGARATTRCSGSRNRAHAIVFQKPTPSLAFGGPRAFGHDGAMGALACVDPDTGIAFAWTIARGPWPGGADPRALALATRPRHDSRRLNPTPLATSRPE